MAGVAAPEHRRRAQSVPASSPQLGPDDVFLINSTSGTTGLPKCVVHTQNRWHLLPPEGRRQRVTDARRRFLARHTHAFRLRNLDQPHHPDLPGRHRGDPGAFHSDSGVRGDSPPPGHRVVLCQYAIDDADGRPRVPGLRPELVACRFRRRRGVAVSAGRGVRGTHRRKDSAVLRLE